ncbi:ABC transporter permease subunit [bacterium]|nr:ABC transporter permease subunit [bacterium]
MMKILLQRLLQLVPTLIGVSILTFLMMRLAPGDPVRLMLGTEASPEAVEELRRQMGLDRPLYEQYFTYMGLNVFSGKTGRIIDVPADDSDTDGGRTKLTLAPEHGFLRNDRVLFTVEGEQVERTISGRIGDTIQLSKPLPDGEVAMDSEIVVPWKRGVLQGNFGTSIVRDRPVTQEILARLPATIELALAAIIFAVGAGLFVGTFSAVYPRSWFESAFRLMVFLFLAMPGFWLGLELIIICSRSLQWFPPSGRGEFGTPSMLAHLFLPAITLGLSSGAFLSRILRSSMLQVLNQDYIRTARAKGLAKGPVVMRHALKNALIPFVTVAGLSMGSLLGGSVIVETVFNWPGVGKLFVESILQRDLPVTMGCVLMLATIFVLLNLAVDLLYTYLDPRIRLDGGAN